MKKKHYNCDPIPMRVLIRCFDQIRPHILMIINKSLESGVFPSSLKHATVTPLVKDRNGDLNEFKNYRPVSNTPFLAKIIEKCVLGQLLEHIRINGLHSKAQSGYKKHHSCETALMKIVNDTQLEIQQNNISVVLMLDQSAAFDTVDHQILLRKLSEKYFISDTALKLLSSFLLGRTFSVVVNGKESVKVPLEYGVPQGAILAPVLYLLYTSDLNDLVNSMGFEIHSFADDNNMYLGFKPLDGMSHAMERLETCVGRVKKYMIENYLQLNVQKTQILFCGSKSNLELYGTRLDEFERMLGENCKRSKFGKTLGIRIDECLKFDEAISDTCSGGYHRLNMLKNMRKVLNIDLKLTLVKCFILSRIDYCNILLNGVTKKQISRLQKLINASLRFVYSVRKSVSVTPYMKRAHILPVSYRIQYKSSLFVYKILHGFSPPYISELVRRKYPHRQGLRSSEDDTLVEPVAEGRTVAATMCRTWNQLPIAMRQIRTIETFKKSLKTHYFCIAFNC